MYLKKYCSYNLYINCYVSRNIPWMCTVPVNTNMNKVYTSVKFSEVLLDRKSVFSSPVLHTKVAAKLASVKEH